MNTIHNTVTAMLAGACLFLLFACAPEVGSEQWCNQMKEKPKADWSANDAADFAKFCIFK